MFGVVWIHSVSCPNWISPPMLNSTFFFLSGIFFKKEPFGPFVAKKARTLLIPFLIFYLLCYPYRIVVHYWDFRTLAGFDWMCIFDLFDVTGRSDYLFVNVPLWFLLCLFIVQVYYFFLSRLPGWVWAVLIVLAMVLEHFIMSVPTPFMLNNAAYWISFFAAGHLCGRRLIKAMSNMKLRLSLLAISLVAIVGITVVQTHSPEAVADFAGQVKLYAIIGLLFAGGSFFDRWRSLRPILFLGKNSLAMLCMHIPPLTVFDRIASKLTDHTPTPMVGFICSLLTCLVCYVAIVWCNRFCPIAVGKRPLPRTD